MTHFRLDVTKTSITSITSGFWPDVTLDGSLPGANPRSQPPIQCNALTCVSGWKLNPMHWACSHHALGRATQQIQDGDDGQPAGAASASSVEGGRRGRSDI